MWALFVMFNKSMNFIRRLNRGNFYFQTRLTGGIKVKEKYKISARSISLRLCLLGQKTQGHRV